jgi:hypothetical protein
MHDEHAALPFLAPVARLVKRTFMADFTREVIELDYVFQAFLDRVPGPDGIGCPPERTPRCTGSLVRSPRPVAARNSDDSGRDRRCGPLSAQTVSRR